MSNADAPQPIMAKPVGFLQPHPLTSVMQLSITAASLCVAAAAIAYAVKSMSEERNARLVEIGVSVLRIDPIKEAQVAAARTWALDLIDTNAGGVKFSKEARAELLQKPLRAFDTSFDAGWGGSDLKGFGGSDLKGARNPPPQSN